MAVRKQFKQKLGEYLAGYGAENNLEEFERYEDDPVGFAEDVLGVTLWSKQQQVARSVLRNRRTVVVGANGVGKDFVAAALALWAVCARRMRVLVTGSSERTAGEVFMEEELCPLYEGAEVPLPGELYSRKLAIPGTGAGVLAMTGRSASTMTGHHHPDGQLAVISEAQGVESHAWEALKANLLSTKARFLALGNPLRPLGEFYQAARSKQWHTIQISAFDHPNIQQQEAVIQGGPTEERIQELKRDWGAESQKFTARVHAEFPTTPSDSLFRRSSIDEAVRRHEEGDFREDREEQKAQLGVDVGGEGPGRTVVCARRGPYVEGFHTVEADSPRLTAERIYEIAADYHEDRHSLVHRIMVDASGLGIAVYEPLKEVVDLDWQVATGGYPQTLKRKTVRIREYKGATSAKQEDRFSNRRTEAYWQLLQWLKEGEAALPNDESLFEELLVHTVTESAKGKIKLGPKEEVKGRLGRSPDLADALALAVLEPKTVKPRGITW